MQVLRGAVFDPEEQLAFLRLRDLGVAAVGAPGIVCERGWAVSARILTVESHHRSLTLVQVVVSESRICAGVPSRQLRSHRCRIKHRENERRTDILDRRRLPCLRARSRIHAFGRLPPIQARARVRSRSRGHPAQAHITGGG